MVSIVSYGRSLHLRTAARAAAEGAALAATAAALVAALGAGRTVVVGAGIGAAAAWAASSASIAWLLIARASSPKAFWNAFGGGIALRAAVLGALAAWGRRRSDVSLAGLLASYGFVLLTLQLILDYRHLRLR